MKPPGQSIPMDGISSNPKMLFGLCTLLCLLTGCITTGSLRPGVANNESRITQRGRAAASSISESEPTVASNPDARASHWGAERQAVSMMAGRSIAQPHKRSPRYDDQVVQATHQQPVGRVYTTPPILEETPHPYAPPVEFVPPTEGPSARATESNGTTTVVAVGRTAPKHNGAQSSQLPPVVNRQPTQNVPVYDPQTDANRFGNVPKQSSDPITRQTEPIRNQLRTPVPEQPSLQDSGEPCLTQDSTGIASPTIVDPFAASNAPYAAGPVLVPQSPTVSRGHLVGGSPMYGAGLRFSTRHRDRDRNRTSR